MPRTLIVQHWTFHTANVHAKNRVDYLPSSLGDARTDLYQFLKSTLKEGQVLNNSEKQRWARIDSVTHSSPRSILMLATSGRYGEYGELIDTDTGSLDFKFDRRHAPTASTRTLFVVPAAGLHAMAFFERSTGHGSSGLDVLRDLTTNWRALQTGVTWKTEWIQDAETWLQDGRLRGIEVRRYGATPSDMPDGAPVTFSYQARRRGGFFSRRTLEHVLARAGSANEIVGIDYQSGDRTYVEMTLGEVQRTFAVEDGATMPSLQQVVEDGTSDDEFVAMCRRLLASRVGAAIGVPNEFDWDAAVNSAR